MCRTRIQYFNHNGENNRIVCIIRNERLRHRNNNQNNLNTHNAYKEFREVRAQLRQEGKQIIGLDLTKYLKNYAAIGEKYVTILEGIIENNSLTDFDKANLLPTKLKKGLAL